MHRATDPPICDRITVITGALARAPNIPTATVVRIVWDRAESLQCLFAVRYSYILFYNLYSEYLLRDAGPKVRIGIKLPYRLH